MYLTIVRYNVIILQIQLITVDILYSYIENKKLN